MQVWFSKFISGRVFSVLFCILGFGLTIYLSSRLGILIEGFAGLDLQLAIFLILTVFCTYMLIYVNTHRENKKTQKLFNLCGIIFSFFPSTVICFFLFDLIRSLCGAYDGRLYLIPLLLAAVLSAYGFVHARKIFVKEYSIPIAASSKHQRSEVKAVLLSDIHTGSYVDRKQLHKIVDAVNRLQPDLVIMAGDTFDQDAFGHCDMDGVKAELQRLQPEGNVYAVLGNHDPDSSHKEVKEYFEEAGIHLLIDECAETEDFLIVGRDDILGNPARKGISELFAGVDTEKPKIVIDHNPLGIEDAVKAGAALILCVHTHKGQFFPATLFTKWAYGRRGFYGHFQTGETHSVVSSGTGYFQLPVRLGTNSEVVVLHIKLHGIGGGAGHLS